jgi:hypothetical protein
VLLSLGSDLVMHIANLVYHHLYLVKHSLLQLGVQVICSYYGALPLAWKVLVRWTVFIIVLLIYLL